MPPNGRRLATPQSVDQAVKAICDIMRRGNCAGALQYVPELTWILFLRILDENEHQEEQRAEALGLPFEPTLRHPYRWRDWAAPPDTLADGETNARTEFEDLPAGALFDFINKDLIPHLKSLRDAPHARPRQKVVSQIMSSVERVRIDTERNFKDVLDRVHGLSAGNVDDTHVFPLSQVYEGLLLKMGEKGNDGGQFFTPREVVRAIVRLVNPRLGETVYDPGCGTGGFLAQAYEHMVEAVGDEASAGDLDRLKTATFFGREKENLVYPIALANLVLHGIDQPNLWHGNTLTGQQVYGGLFQDAPEGYDVVLTNPPFGGKEGKEAQNHFAYKTGATQCLFLQHILENLRAGGRCGMVLDEGLLFRTNEDAFVKTKRKLLDECELQAVVSLPPGVFSAAGAGVKTNLLFFTKGKPTENVWYYDLSDVKVGKKTPLTLAHFEELFRLFPDRADSERSWTVNLVERRRRAVEDAEPLKEQAAGKQREADRWKQRVAELKRAGRPNEDVEEALQRATELAKEGRELAARAKDSEDAVYDLKAVNPNRSAETETRTPEELIAIVEEQAAVLASALASLRAALASD